MVYIYDIILNFNEDLLEFFEWEENDLIKYVKKLPLLRVESSFIFDLINNNVVLDSGFINMINNGTDYYDSSDSNPVVIFADSNIAVALLIKDNKTFLYSRLLLDEEYEAISIASKINITKIDYNIISAKEINNNLTREEKKIKSILIKEFKDLYNDNKLDKLNYYYYEYFNEINNNKDEVYNRLIDSLKIINDKHLELLEIVKLANK